MLLVNWAQIRSGVWKEKVVPCSEIFFKKEERNDKLHTFVFLSQNRADDSGEKGKTKIKE